MKIVACIMALMIFTSFLGLDLITAEKADGGILYVGGEGPGNYTKIQDAINDASDGYTIKVYPGVYEENIIVNKELRLIGDPIIDAHGGIGVVIERNNTLLENFTILNASIGIKVYNSSTTLHNVTIKECKIYNYTVYGIFVLGTNDSNIIGILITNENASHVGNNGICTELSTNISIQHCYITTVYFDGIYIRNSADIEIKETEIRDAMHGINVYASHDCSVIKNRITNNEVVGIILENSIGSRIVDNTMTNNGIVIVGDNNLDYFISHIIENNTVNGKPIYYMKNEGNGSIPEDAGEIILANCSQINITGITFSLSTIAIELAFSNHCIISSNTIENEVVGILTIFSDENIIEKNRFYDNLWAGMMSFVSNQNRISQNIFTFNNYSIYLVYSHGNEFLYNNFSNNERAIYLSDSNNNSFYMNNFINNTEHVLLDNSPDNNWNSTEKIDYIYNGTFYTNYLGNYWYDYDGVDTDGDGIGDTAYNLSEGKDYYPLMEPWENYVNKPPVANFTYYPINPSTEDIINFTDLSYDPDGYIVNWTWTFGDGNVSYDRNPKYRYDKPGTYNVTLTVTDNDGASSTITKTLTVADVTPPTLSIERPKENRLYLLGLEIWFPLKTSWIIGPIDVIANAVDYETGIDRVEFYVDGELKENDTIPPYTYTLYIFSLGSLHTISVKAYDRENNVATENVTVRIFSFRLS